MYSRCLVIIISKDSCVDGNCILNCNIIFLNKVFMVYELTSNRLSMPILLGHCTTMAKSFFLIKCNTTTSARHAVLRTYISDKTEIHSIGMCRMWRFLAVLRSFFHSSLLCTFSCHPSPPTTILPSSLTSSCHLFLGLSLNIVVLKFVYNTLLGILFSSILCTRPNQCNQLNLTVSIIVGFLTLA